MSIVRTVVAGLALGGMVMAGGAASAEGGRGVRSGGSTIGAPAGFPGVIGPVFESVGRDRSDGPGKRRGRGRFVDSGFLGYAEPSHRHNRTALSRGYFGHGATDGRGRYDYDRGYPYDYYNDRYAEHESGYLEDNRADRGVSRCDVERVWDDQAGEDVAVRICRN